MNDTQWRPMGTEPRDCSWVEVLLPDGTTCHAHWASDLSGEEQPLFQGWFQEVGDYFKEVFPKSWRPILVTVQGENVTKFRKKPVEVDAFQWMGGPIRPDHPVWAIEASQKCYGTLGSVSFHDTKQTLYPNVADVHLKIWTLEGVMIAQPNDWIIQGVKGELYPCRPDIFEATYEPVLTEREDAGRQVGESK